jgi:GNAT superfamily N-acetyltransferase
MSEFSLQMITTEQTYDLRSRILRPGQPASAFQYAEDFDHDTFHLGIFYNGAIVGNGTFMKMNSPLFSNIKKAYRLRGMATDSSFQKKGLGSKIIMAAEEVLVKRECDLLWFNARTTAEIFYQKLGYVSTGEIFDIPGGGPHKVMYKHLKSR